MSSCIIHNVTTIKSSTRMISLLPPSSLHFSLPLQFTYINVGITIRLYTYIHHFIPERMADVLAHWACVNCRILKQKQFSSVNVVYKNIMQGVTLLTDTNIILYHETYMHVCIIFTVICHQKPKECPKFLTRKSLQLRSSFTILHFNMPLRKEQKLNASTRYLL